MKFLLSTALILLLAIQAQAQSFEIVESKNIFKGIVGEQIEAEIPIKNLTNQPLELVIKRIDEVIGTSQSTYICWDGRCLPSKSDVLSGTNKIAAGELTTKFSSILETGLVPGISTVKYLIYDRNNPSEALEYEVEYTIEERSESKSLYDSQDIQLTEIFPNPVSEFAILNYELKNPETKAKVVLHNVLGSIVSEYELLPFENKLKIETDNFNPGVYFYSLYLDGDGVATHKLIIRK